MEVWERISWAAVNVSFEWGALNKQPLIGRAALHVTAWLSIGGSRLRLLFERSKFLTPKINKKRDLDQKRYSTIIRIYRNLRKSLQILLKKFFFSFGEICEIPKNNQLRATKGKMYLIRLYFCKYENSEEKMIREMTKQLRLHFLNIKEIKFMFCI